MKFQSCLVVVEKNMSAHSEREMPLHKVPHTMFHGSVTAICTGNAEGISSDNTGQRLTLSAGLL